MRERHPDPKNKILLVNITRLGDMLQATPTISGMKLENPECKVSVLVEKQFEDVCHIIPDIDEVLSIDLGMTVRSLAREQDGIIDAYEYVSELIDGLRGSRFDYCLNMSSSGYTALLLRALDIRRNGGWSADEEGYRVIESDWARLFASSVFHQNRQYNALNLVDVFRCSADVEQHPPKLMLNVDKESLDYAQGLIAEAGFTNTGPIIGVQAGASQGKRQWNPSRFVRMVNKLIAPEGNARVVLTGSKKELPIMEQIKAECASPNVFIAGGRTNIPQLAALLKLSDILITGDTGPMHMSVAVGTPVVSLFLASAFGFETGTYSEGNIVIQPVIGCGPCNPNKNCTGLECHDTIDSELVAYLALRRVKEDFREVPDQIADPKRVIVYRSTFDRFGFLDFEPLNSAKYDSIKQYRDAYRKVWIDDLAGLPQSPNAAAPGRGMLSMAPTGLDGINEVIQQAEQGRVLIHQLISLVKDQWAAPQALGEVNKRLGELDREIEQTGFHYPHLGPVTRMFVFAKENLSGSDPVELASQMGKVYEDLTRRCTKLQVYIGQ